MGRRWNPLSLGLVLILVLVVSVTGCGEKEEVEKESQISVNVAKATVQNIAETDSYSGIIRGKNEVYIMPKISARVTGIYVKPGDVVSAGQRLVTLDSTDYEAGVQQAQAAISAAQAAVTAAQAGKAANDIQAETARANYERTKKLYEAGAASAQQLEAAQSQYESLVTGRAEAAVAQAQAGVQQAQAGLAQAQTALNNCVLTSPINGVVGNINLSLGDTTNPAAQQPAVIVTETGQLEVEVLVGESDISYIKQGSAVDVVVKAASDKTFKGTVEHISTVADPTKRSYPVKVVLNNRDGLIRSGMFAEVRISTVSKNQVVCVPSTAVVPKGGREVVYIIDKDKRARQVEVTTGIRNSKYVEIVKGLKAGQQVITKGNTLVNEGTLVRVVGGGK
ncbi:MAG: efflux RND transporter periplasmic adaptor subunit [Syntrophomonadaceae bacterium]